MFVNTHGKLPEDKSIRNIFPSSSAVPSPSETVEKEGSYNLFLWVFYRKDRMLRVLGILCGRMQGWGPIC